LQFNYKVFNHKYLKYICHIPSSLFTAESVHRDLIYCSVVITFTNTDL